MLLNFIDKLFQQVMAIDKREAQKAASREAIQLLFISEVYPVWFGKRDEGNIDKIKVYTDHDRTRTCNPQIRGMDMVPLSIATVIEMSRGLNPQNVAP